MNKKDLETNYTSFLINTAKIIANHLSDTMPNDYINQLDKKTDIETTEIIEVKEVKKFDKNNILLWLSIGFLLILLANGGNKNV